MPRLIDHSPSRPATKLLLLAWLMCIYGCDTRTSTPNPVPSSGPNVDAPRHVKSRADDAREISTAINSTPSGPDQPHDANASDPVIATNRSRAQDAIDQSLLDPRKNGWDSEAVAESAQARFHQFNRVWTANTDSRADQLMELTAASFRCGPLRPTSTREVFRDQTTTVLRPKELNAEIEYSFHGVAGLLDAMRPMDELLHGATEIEPHIKVIGISPIDRAIQGVLTTCDFEISGHAQEKSLQINATWLCQWELVKDRGPLLKSIRISDYEEVVVRNRDGGRWFSDRTAAVIGQDASYQGQLTRGHHGWLQRIETVHRFDTSARNGLAIGDANGDGLDDLYLCQPPGLPNCLYVQNADGTATNMAADFGVDWLDQTSSALFLDLDNDGDQDLAVGTTSGLLIMENRDNKMFDLQAQLKMDYDIQSLSAVDYDSDGHLDIFVCVYRTERSTSNAPFLYRDGRGGGTNRLFRNLGAEASWRFEDVTQRTGLLDGATRFTLAASWEDYDNDGDQDLYVANDFGRNYLYENRDGHFLDVAEQHGVLDIGSGMSVSWGDYNRDGRMDLYVGNMFSSAGMRVTSSPHFRPTEEEDIRQIYVRLAKGNSLFLNRGNGFDDVGKPANVEMGRWAWSSVFTELNNDGWEDLLVANGYFTTDDTGDL